MKIIKFIKDHIITYLITWVCLLIIMWLIGSFLAAGIINPISIFDYWEGRYAIVFSLVISIPLSAFATSINED